MFSHPGQLALLAVTVMDALDVTQSAGKWGFHLTFFRNDGNLSNAPEQTKLYQSSKNGSADRQLTPALVCQEQTFPHDNEYSQKHQHFQKEGPQSPTLTLLSNFFIVTRSRDLSECPVGVMKYRQTWILVSW